MPRKAQVVIDLQVVATNDKALRALYVVVGALQNIADDFGYRDDVVNALKAGKYLLKNVSVRGTVAVDGRAGVSTEIDLGHEE